VDETDSGNTNEEKGIATICSELASQQTGEIDMIPYFVERNREMTGKMVKNAHGVDRFATVPKDNICRGLGVVLNKKLYPIAG
jgi:hypothetical protein